MPLRFRCARTGLIYPADYIEEWGRKYGIGLGPIPVSEALINDYHRPVAVPDNGDESLTMHGLSVCRSQMDYVEVTEEEIERKSPVLAINDPTYRVRGQIMRDKQLIKSTSMQSRFRDEISAAQARINTREKVATDFAEVF